MPNNRNRNRNRNRNKRNRNQNPHPNQNQTQAEEVQPEEQSVEDTQSGIAVSTSSSIDDNGNSGSVSNGPPQNDNSNAESSIISEPKVTNTPQQQEEGDIKQDIENTSEMGAKNSKHHKDKAGKQAKQVEEQVRPGPTIIRRPPGSPRQAKVIVHRIVKEEDKVDKAEVPQPEAKVVAVKVEPEEDKVDKTEVPAEQPKILEIKVEPAEDEVDNSKVPADQPKVVEIKVEQEALKEDELEEETIQPASEAVKDEVVTQVTPISEKLNKELEDLVEKAQELQDIAQAVEPKPSQKLTKVQEEQPAQEQEPSPLPEEKPPTNIPEVQDHPIQPSPPQQRTSKVIIHKIRLETDEEERERKGKPTIEEISSTSGSSLAGTLSPPPRYLVESPKNVTTGSGGQFARFSRDVQIQELELNSDCSSGEFNVTLSPLVCEADSETEGSGSAGGAGQQERSPPEQPSSSSRVEQQEQLRQKRAQKRNALESHFLPQLLNPRYLDSILEENGETPSYKSSSSNSSSAANSRTPKLNESFPKSQLDFSRRHKRREEAPTPLKLETKFLDQPLDLESCTRLQSTLSPQSEDAELVYLSSSASSSVSDLMELELEQAAALAERALVDLDTDASRLINPPDDEMSSTSTTTAERSETEAETETETEREVPESRESTPVNGSSQLTLAPTAPPLSTPTSAPSAREPLAKDTNVSNGSLSASFGAASPLAATREEFVRNMDKVRELIEMTRREQEEVTGTPRSPSPPPVPPPPVGHQLYSNTHIVPLSLDTTSFANLKRQESNDSHCSDSTTHSQCTAINLASPPLPSTQPPTPPLRQKPAPQVALAPPPVPVSVPEPTPTPPPTPESTIAAPNSEPELSVADSDSDAIKKLRLLCTETLASMPYGEQVLEELASVAQNIASKSQANMPYPMPQLPHIKELELSSGEGKSSSAWLVLPTQSDPQLLVCLSPGQRQLLDGETQPDQLLDAHQKFVERRGYHELSKAQVLEQQEKQQQEKQQQQQSEMLKTAAMMRELRKSLSPSKSPPPVPPPPVPVKSAETAAKANANTHANAKRDDASEQKQKIEASESSSLENKPRRAADLYEQQQSAEHRQSSSTTMTSSSTSTTGTGKFPTLESMESELARMFPHRPKSGDIFEEQRKRFSNIEFPSHVPLATQSQKRYSNIETSSYESKKRTENGQVVYDVSTSSHEKKEQGDPPKDGQQQPQPPAPPVPPPPIMSATKLNGGTFIDGDNKPKNSQPEKENSASNGTYEEFRQRAKAAVDAIGGDHQQQQQQQQQNGLDHDRVFKDFDRLSQQMHAELQSTRERREKSASLYNLSGLTRPASTGQQKLEELQQRRHAHMQELEREIERSAKSRQERMSSVPRQLEATPPHVHEIPIELESRSRRAESLCNLNEPPPRPHTTVGNYGNSQTDDWARYASDLGYSENIARPFAREVEICYQRQNPRASHGIRAPRLSASTNDLSSSSQYSFDSFNAYGGRRTHAPMLNQVQQQPRPHYGSCYSMIERDPNPRYISTTSRRGVSPAPGAVAAPPLPLQPPPAYDRQQRRASLPRELHEQQLKYILSKEEELKLEVERLQHERRRLMEEMQRAPVLPAPQRRESYRPAAKLPTLSEDEVFRQQMAEEWMNKVAEREERRHNKIIRISKIEDEAEHATAERGTISDEFLDRVKERRHKLSMPADSDWESGAESQPQPNANQSQGESDVEAPPVRILEGQAEANLRQLPRHLREFAKFSTSEQLPDGGQMERHEQQERHEEATDNSHSSASKKTSIVKTYKVSRLPPSVQDEATETTDRSSTIHRIDRQESQESSSSSGSRASKFGGHWEDFFAGSPFRSKIFEEFDKYWRNFEHSASNTF